MNEETTDAGIEDSTRDGEWSVEDSNLVQHARRELELIGAFELTSFYGDLVGRATLELIKVFAKQGHSGVTAHLVRDLFTKLAAFLPVTPLTGEDDEWHMVSEGLWQNKRSSRVFKDADGECYDVEGRTFVFPDGGNVWNKSSRTPVTFPYTPSTECIDVDENGVPVQPGRSHETPPEWTSTGTVTGRIESTIPVPGDRR